MMSQTYTKPMTEKELLIVNLLANPEHRKLKCDDIVQLTKIPTRSVRYTLRRLLNANIIICVPDFEDLRTNYYALRKVKTEA